MGSTPEAPEAPEPMPEIEEIDVSGQKQYTKSRIKNLDGRQSTILGSQKMGSNNTGKKTILG